MKNKSIVLGCAVLLSVLGMQVCAVCPSMDATDDCYVTLEDFAVFAHQWLTGNGVPDDMVFLKGTFQMGDSFQESWDNELPVHSVTLGSFYIGKYEISNGLYCAFLNSSLQQGLITVTKGIVYQAGSGTSYPYCDTSQFDSTSQIDYSSEIFRVGTKIGRSMSNDPMILVSWYGAVAYCNWRSQQEGRQACYDLSTWKCDFSKKGYRLPTEAEWEYAARGGLSGKRFPWGDTITHSRANYYSDSNVPFDISPTRGSHPTWDDDIGPYTSPVGTFSPNGYDLYDMAGNVLEWCHDWYSDTYYGSSPINNPTGPGTGTHRVFRGGSWGYYCVLNCRVSVRFGRTPSHRICDIGFRLVRDF
jgi:sulfatase modifying factor 1